MFQVDKDTCIGCGCCVDVCPQNAIAMVDNIASIDGDACIDCGMCAQNCPVEAIAHAGEVPKKSVPRPQQIVSESTVTGRGRCLGKGMGRGLGRGPRDGRGGGRGGGGRK